MVLVGNFHITGMIFRGNVVYYKPFPVMGVVFLAAGVSHIILGYTTMIITIITTTTQFFPKQCVAGSKGRG